MSVLDGLSLIFDYDIKAKSKIAIFNPHATIALKVCETVQNCKYHKRSPSIRALVIRDPF
jgi:hypothetical protein